MRIVLQRCLQGSVTVNNQKVSEIGKAQGDSKELLKYWGEKILKIKLWKDDKDKGWSSCIIDNNYEFTLNATLNGNKPDFRQSMDADQARIMFDYFVKVVEMSYQKDKVKTGVFQNHMQVALINDGPVTINIDDDGLQNQEVIKAIYKNNKLEALLSKKNHKQQGITQKKGDKKEDQKKEEELDENNIQQQQ